MKLCVDDQRKKSGQQWGNIPVDRRKGKVFRKALGQFWTKLSPYEGISNDLLAVLNRFLLMLCKKKEIKNATRPTQSNIKIKVHQHCQFFEFITAVKTGRNDFDLVITVAWRTFRCTASLSVKNWCCASERLPTVTTRSKSFPPSVFTAMRVISTRSFGSLIISFSLTFFFLLFWFVLCTVYLSQVPHFLHTHMHYLIISTRIACVHTVYGYHFRLIFLSAVLVSRFFFFSLFESRLILGLPWSVFPWTQQ